MDCDPKRPPIEQTTNKRQSMRKLSHKQEMEKTYSEGKQHQPQSSRTCYVHDVDSQKKIQIASTTTSMRLYGNQTTTG